MDNIQRVINLILKAVALGMGVAVVVLGVLGTLSAETGLTMLGLGLATLALAALQKED